MKFVRARFRDLEMAMISLVNMLPAHFLRILVVKAFGARLAHGVTMYHGVQVRNARGLDLGERVSVGDGTVLDARGGLKIGHDTNISTEVQIWSAQHDWRSVDFAYQTAAVTIGHHAWISARAIVLPGSEIGDGAVIAAGAVVSGKVAPYTLVAGVPAREIAERPQPSVYRLPRGREKSWWW